MSFTIRLSETFSDASLPLLTRDAIINPGSLYLYDFADPVCNREPAGPLPTATEFIDLCETPVRALVSGTGFASLASGGLTSSGAYGASITIGAPGQFDLQPTNAEFLVICWLNTPVSGYQTEPYQRIVSMGTPANGLTAQWWIDNGADGRIYRFQTGWGANLINQQFAAQNTGVPRQYALHVRPAAGLLSVFIDGVQMSAATPFGSFTLASAPAAAPVFNGRFIGALYRWYQENLSISGRSAREQVALDFALNNGRFQ